MGSLDKEQCNRKSWKVGVSPCSFSHLQPTKVNTTQSDLLPQGFLSWRKKQNKKTQNTYIYMYLSLSLYIYLNIYQHILLCLYGAQQYVRLQTTVAPSAASTSLKPDEEMLGDKDTHSSLGLLSLLHFHKLYSGVSFKSVLWQEEPTLTTVTSYHSSSLQLLSGILLKVALEKLLGANMD